MRAIVMGVCFLVATAACGDGPLSARYQPEVVNNTDSFEFQTTGLPGVSSTLRYSWQNTGVRANVDQASAVTGGAVTLTIRDADGRQVYSRSLSDNGTFVTGAGTAGVWAIEIVFSRATGTVNFRAQKTT